MPTSQARGTEAVFQGCWTRTGDRELRGFLISQRKPKLAE